MVYTHTLRAAHYHSVEKLELGATCLGWSAADVELAVHIHHSPLFDLKCIKIALIHEHHIPRNLHFRHGDISHGRE